MLKKMCIFTLGLTLAVSLSACGKKSTPAPTVSSSVAPTSSTTEPTGTAAVDTSAVAQTVFKQNCVSCHGVDLGGGVGPSLQKVGARLTQQQIAATITNGKGVMPAFKDKLKPEEIDALSSWLAAKK
jgi:cytochrome c551